MFCSKRVLMLVIVFCLLSACSTNPQEMILRKENPELVDQVDNLLNSKSFNGSVLIAKDGVVWISKGYGMANFEKKIPNTAQTIYRIGSITKPFTAISIMRLQEQGLLNVQDTLDKYIPDYPNGDQIKLHHLLSHTSGIEDYILPEELDSLSPHYISPVEIIDLFKQKPLRFTPGAQFSYSNSNFILLGFIIEQITKQTYEEYVTDNFVKPLHMTQTGYDKNTFNEKIHATGYSGTPEEPKPPTWSIDMSAAYAAGALYSNVEDLFLWNQALDNNKMISEQSLNTMFTPVIDVEKDAEKFAYSWFVSEGPPKEVAHGGNIAGFSTLFIKNLESKSVIIIMCNFDSYTVIGQIAKDLSKLLYDNVQ